MSVKKGKFRGQNISRARSILSHQIPLSSLHTISCETKDRKFVFKSCLAKTSRDPAGACGKYSRNFVKGLDSRNVGFFLSQSPGCYVPVSTDTRKLVLPINHPLIQI